MWLSGRSAVHEGEEESAEMGCAHLELAEMPWFLRQSGL